ncbi:UNVERIFIED_CONTAM: hypothetical protein Sangu_1571600 [Sesamum angustifolium]|uniref:Zinc finger BED domain-containing protein RICESLEEPER 2-like n=1 Tax=Sesamum angustifolium TaxID=2727405 RepID=A0AAW2MRN4_9LAMI
MNSGTQNDNLSPYISTSRVDSTDSIFQPLEDGIRPTMDDIDPSPNTNDIDMSTDTTVVDKDEETSLPKVKRQKKSIVWLEFKDVKDADGSVKISCNHCKKMFGKAKKMEYMVITGHWIDQNWQLQKCVLNFVHIPPPCRGLEIADAIWRCLDDWDIQSKIHTVSVDNASANDSAIFHLKTYAQRKKKLLCEGKLFHVRCCAHILNLIAQDGICEIKDIVEVIRDSVEYVRQSDARLLLFSEIVKQLNLPERKLVDDCRTRWNSTYEMLSTAIKFKDVFQDLLLKIHIMMIPVS